jgi:hypothetical protein
MGNTKKILISKKILKKLVKCSKKCRKQRKLKQYTCVKKCYKSKRTRTRKGKSRKGKSRKGKSRKGKSRKGRKRKRMRGGYGKAACPFAGGQQWNATTGGTYYKHNQNGIGVGGLDPYGGNNSPSPQHGGGLFQHLVTNPSRELTGSLGNLYNTYQGQRRTLSPAPYIQPLSPLH